MAGTDLLSRMKQRKLWQWSLAYVAGAWLLLQIVDLLTQNLELSHTLFRVVLVLVGAGFPAMLVLAWYHGEKGRQRASGIEVLMLAGILVLAGAALAYVTTRARRVSAASGSAGAAVDKASIAVLPFLDLSPRHDQEYFSDGLTEELLNVLAKVPALRVAARTSSFAFKGKDVEIDSIGRALRVAHVLEGSMRTDGVRVRITAQLIDARSGYHLWSENYDRNLRDIFALQGEISAAIAEQLKLKLGAPTAQVAAAGTTDPQAHLLLLQADQVLRRGETGAPLQAEQLLRQALQRDPRYAQAHAALAGAYLMQAYMRLAPPEERYGMAEAEARRALTLDPQNAEAHTVLGRIAETHDWDFRAAEQHYRLALESNPSDARAHGERAWLLMRLHRTDEAIAEGTRATVLDPLSDAMQRDLGAIYSYAGRAEQAIEATEAAVALEPSSIMSLANLAVLYTLAGRPDDARRTIEKVLQAAPDNANASAYAAYIQAMAGRRSDAERLLRTLEEKPDLSPYLLAQIHLALGERDRAIELLRKAVRAHDDFAVDAGVDPVFAPLRGDARFEQILKEGGLN